MANIFQSGPNRPVLLVGLGNPGPEYTHSRHNAGFLILDALAHALHTNWHEKPSWCGLVAQPAPSVYLLKPTTFMNASGQAVAAVQNYFDIPSSNVMIVYDDRDLDFGRIKITTGFRTGAHHNGVKSVAQHIGNNFQRIRFGIGNDHMRHKNVRDFVLENFTSPERKAFEQLMPYIIQQLRHDLDV